MDPADLLEGLTPAQREAVTTDGAPLCILAGAGAGKTRVLTRRMAYRILTGAADAQHTLALTFTRRAAAELGRRLGALGVRDRVAAGTFHAVAYARLRTRALSRGERPPSLLQHRSRLLSDLPGRRGGTQAAVLGAEIDWAKTHMVAPVDYEAAATAAGRAPPLPLSVVSSLYGRYEDEKRKKGVIDFDDLLLLCVRAIEHDQPFAAAETWWFRHLLVDEFQDVNPLQFRLLEAWRAGRDDLCVVGDPNQAIYAWNGADPDLLRSFPDRFPKATVVRLDANFRSTPQILAVARAVLDGGQPTSDIGTVANRADGPPPTVRAYATDLDEARGIARAVRDSRPPGTPWAWVAVLARTHAQLSLVQEALRAAAVPTRMRGSTLLALPEVRDTLHEVRKAGAAPFPSVLADLQALGSRHGPLGELAALAREYAAIDATPSVDGFLLWVGTTGGGADDVGSRDDAVDLATFHAAKGLEWPVVFVAGLEEGFVPIARAATDEAVAEERRLLYVALTRAEHELHCSWAERRTFGERAVARRPSPWLAELEVALAEQRAADAPAHAGRRVSRARPPRKRSRAAPGPDPQLLTALRSWRAGLARAAGVPPAVVLDDRALAAVASAKPTGPDELRAVPGIGPVRARRYGPAILEVLAGPLDP